MNFSPHWCNWSWSYNWYSPSPNSSVHSKFLTISVISSEVMLAHLVVSPKTSFRRIWSLDDHALLLSPGLLQVSIHSLNGARKYQWGRGDSGVDHLGSIHIPPWAHCLRIAILPPTDQGQLLLTLKWPLCLPSDSWAKWFLKWPVGSHNL